MNSSENILSLIPQRPPFVMIDELLYADEMLVSTAFQIKAENILVENGKFSESGIVENIAQTAAAHAGSFSKSKNENVALGYIVAIKNLQIFSLPNINDKLLTEVKIVNQIFDVTIIEGKVFCDNKLIAQCEMKIFVPSNNSDNNQL
ncbi:MAG: 3-hydroxyacyl-ACP dehydratase [Arachidicoccus sp.]|nr:3-hydroxyacyl-ACP dehydratase [Arachidicoccus sp.]